MANELPSARETQRRAESLCDKLIYCVCVYLCMHLRFYWMLMCAELPRYCEAISAPSWTNYSCSATARGTASAAHMEKKRTTHVFMYVCRDMLTCDGGRIGKMEVLAVWRNEMTIITCFAAQSKCSWSLNGWAASTCNNINVSTGRDPAVVFICSRQHSMQISFLWINLWWIIRFLVYVHQVHKKRINK